MNVQLKIAIALRRCIQLIASGDAQTGFVRVNLSLRIRESLSRAVSGCTTITGSSPLCSFINDRFVTLISVSFNRCTINDYTRIFIDGAICDALFHRLYIQLYQLHS